MGGSIPLDIPRVALMTGDLEGFGGPVGGALVAAGFAVTAQAGEVSGNADVDWGPNGLLLIAGQLGDPLLDDEARQCRGHRASFRLIRQFAEALPAGKAGMVVNLICRPTPSHSFGLEDRAAAALAGRMALSLAPRIRFNAIAFGATTSPEDIGRTIVALLAMTSATGELIRLREAALPIWRSAVRRTGK